MWRMSAVSFSAAEESSDSLDAEEIAQIKVQYCFYMLFIYKLCKGAASISLFIADILYIS